MNIIDSPLRRWIFRFATLVVASITMFYFWPTDISRVEKNTRKLLKSISKTGNESMPIAAARSLDAVSYLASNVVLDLGAPFPASMRKSEIAPLLQQARMRASTLEIKSLGHQVEKKTDGSIWMDITLDADVEVRGAKDQLLGNYRLVWRKSENEWKVSRAEVIDVIKHPSGSTFPY